MGKKNPVTVALAYETQEITQAAVEAAKTAFEEMEWWSYPVSHIATRFAAEAAAVVLSHWDDIVKGEELATSAWPHFSRRVGNVDKLPLDPWLANRVVRLMSRGVGFINDFEAAAETEVEETAHDFFNLVCAAIRRQFGGNE